MRAVENVAPVAPIRRDDQDTESMTDSVREQAAQDLEQPAQAPPPRTKRRRVAGEWEGDHPCGSHLTIAFRTQGTRKALVILFADGTQILQIPQNAFGDTTLQATKQKATCFMVAIAKKYITGEIDKEGLYGARDTMIQDPHWGCILPPIPRPKAKAKLEKTVKDENMPAPVTPPPVRRTRSIPEMQTSIREQMLPELSCNPPVGSWENAEYRMLSQRN